MTLSLLHLEFKSQFFHSSKLIKSKSQYFHVKRKFVNVIVLQWCWLCHNKGPWAEERNRSGDMIIETCWFGFHGDEQFICLVGGYHHTAEKRKTERKNKNITMSSLVSRKWSIRRLKFHHVCSAHMTQWPAPLNKALWEEHQKWEKYFIALQHSDAKIIALRYSYQKLWNVEHLHVPYHSKQFYRDIGCQRLAHIKSKCFITLFPFTFSMKKVWLFGMMNIYEENEKVSRWLKFWPIT